MNKHTIVIGASINEERYSNKAIYKLLKYKHTVYAIGVKKGEVEGVTIHKDFFDIKNLHTVTLYINPILQKNYYDYILSLQPKRIIFNPGTENEEFFEMASGKGIMCMDACTLVLLQTNQY